MIKIRFPQGKVDFVKTFELRIYPIKGKEKISKTFLFMYPFTLFNNFWRRLEGFYCNKRIKIDCLMILKFWKFSNISIYVIFSGVGCYLTISLIRLQTPSICSKTCPPRVLIDRVIITLRMKICVYNYRVECI